MAGSKMRAAWIAAGVVALSSSGIVRGDEVRFKNGDRLTGTILSADAGSLKIKTAVAGEVKVKLEDVETFTTDAPVELKLKDGSTLKQRAEPGDSGSVKTAGGDVVAPQVVPLTAIEQLNPPPVQWTGALTIGGLLTRGNTDTDNFNLGFDASRRAEKDRFTLGAGYFYGRQKNQDTGDKSTTIDNWFGLGKYDYFFSPKLYGYGLVRIERDRIADLKLRLTPGVGLGYQWVERPDLKFATEVGIGWVYEEYETGDSEDHIAARLAYHFEKQINDKVAFRHNLEFLPSVEDVSDFNAIADAGVRTTLTDKMFAEFKVEYRYDATPAPSAQKSDVRYILGVGWGF